MANPSSNIVSFELSSNFDKNHQQDNNNNNQFSNKFNHDNKSDRFNQSNQYDQSNEMNEVKVISFRNNNNDDEFVSPFSDWTARQRFIRSVYFILSFQNFFTFGLSCLFLEVDDVRLFIDNNSWIAIVFLIISVILLIPVLCFRPLRSKLFLNLFVLIVFTITKSIYTSLATVDSDRPDIEHSTSLITGYIFLSLAFLNHQTRKDVSILNEISFILILYWTSVSAISFFSNTRFNDQISYSITNQFMCCFFALDVHLIVEVQELNYKLDTNDFIYVSLVLYLDFLKLIGLIILAFFMIFYNILFIFIAFCSRRRF